MIRCKVITGLIRFCVTTFKCLIYFAWPCYYMHLASESCQFALCHIIWTQVTPLHSAHPLLAVIGCRWGALCSAVSRGVCCNLPVHLNTVCCIIHWALSSVEGGYYETSAFETQPPRWVGFFLGLFGFLVLWLSFWMHIWKINNNALRFCTL